MKILQVVQSLGKGGAERLVLEISQALKKNYPNIENKIVSLSTLNEYETLCSGLDIVYCNSYVKLSILGPSKINIVEFEKIVDEFCPNVIHSHTYTAELVSREHIRHSITYITHCHNNMPEFSHFNFSCIYKKDSFTRYFEKIRMERKYKSCKNRFIAISKDTLKYYKENLSRHLSENIYYLPNAIDYNKFYFEKTYVTGSKTLHLIHVGSFNTNKNQHFLVIVAKLLLDKNVDFELHFLGNGELLNQEKQYAENCGLQDVVSFHGNVDNVEDFLRKSDIYVHSSLSEALGLTIIEAMATGLPVVTLDGKGNRDLIEEGKNGYMIYEQNPELFADKILEIWNNKQRYQEMSLYAQEYAKQYDIVPYVDKLLCIYTTNYTN